MSTHSYVTSFLRKNYQLADSALQFFTVHEVADEEHTAMATGIIARTTDSEAQQGLVQKTADQAIRFKLGKFEGLYNAYA